ncbi:hypothetical protein ACX40Y_07460 [Sphingomonas sp. RS6]
MTEAPVNNTPFVLEGIVRLRCLQVTYNRTRMIVAPHILYTRNESLYTDALVVSREGMLPREPKIGTFKVDGLREVAVLDRAFEISPLFDAELDKYAGVTLMAIEPEA